MTRIADDDYILSDGSAWLETAGYAIRIFTSDNGAVFVDVCKSGDEMGETLASCHVGPIGEA